MTERPNPWSAICRYTLPGAGRESLAQTAGTGSGRADQSSRCWSTGFVICGAFGLWWGWTVGQPRPKTFGWFMSSMSLCPTTGCHITARQLLPWLAAGRKGWNDRSKTAYSSQTWFFETKKWDRQTKGCSLTSPSKAIETGTGIEGPWCPGKNRFGACLWKRRHRRETTQSARRPLIPNPDKNGQHQSEENLIGERSTQSRRDSENSSCHRDRQCATSYHHGWADQSPGFAFHRMPGAGPVRVSLRVSPGQPWPALLRNFGP